MPHAVADDQRVVVFQIIRAADARDVVRFLRANVIVNLNRLSPRDLLTGHALAHFQNHFLPMKSNFIGFQAKQKRAAIRIIPGIAALVYLVTGLSYYAVFSIAAHFSKSATMTDSICKSV